MMHSVLQKSRTYNSPADEDEDECEEADLAKSRLSVGLGDTFQLVLFLNGIRVGRALCCIDKLISKAFGDGLDVPEGALASADGEEGDGLVDTAQRRHINSLSPDGTLRANTGAIFSWACVDNSIDEDLYGILVCKEVDDLEGMCDDSDSQDLLAVVTTVHHEGIHKTFDDGHLSLLELLALVSTESVWQIDSMADLNVVGEGDILHFNLCRIPLAKQPHNIVIGRFSHMRRQVFVATSSSTSSSRSSTIRVLNLKLLWFGADPSTSLAGNLSDPSDALDVVDGHSEGCVEGRRRR